MSLHVAIDVHDRTLFAVGVDPATGEECFRRRFPHTPPGTADLHGRLAPGDIAVLEATRGSQHLARHLETSGATILLLDPQQCRLVGFRGKKTDYRDCRALLSHLRSGYLPVVWRPDAPTRERRQLARERQAYNQTVTQLKNRMIALLREEGVLPPGLELWEAAGEAWLRGAPVPTATRAVLLRSWTLLRAALAVKELQTESFHAQALADPRVWWLMQLPGFGPTASVTVLGELGELSRFAEGKQVASYAGLDPRIAQSGDVCHGGRISKSGRPLLRWAMVEVAWAHVLADGPEAGLYHRLVARGKPKGVAITALARHLLVLAWKLLTRGENYQKLERWGYLRKLAILAASRPAAERKAGGGTTDIAWARERYRELTGEEPPAAAPPAAEKNAGSTSGAAAAGVPRPKRQTGVTARVRSQHQQAHRPRDADPA